MQRLHVTALFGQSVSERCWPVTTDKQIKISAKRNNISVFGGKIPSDINRKKFRLQYLHAYK